MSPYALFIPLLCACIYIVYSQKIQNKNLSYLILLVVGLPLLYGMLFTPFKEDSSHCVVGCGKKISGVLFGGCIDIWHVLHVLLWVLIGLLNPGMYKEALAASLAWEITEHFGFKRAGCTDMCCGRVEDVFLNMIGYTIGSYLVTVS